MRRNAAEADRGEDTDDDRDGLDRALLEVAVAGIEAAAARGEAAASAASGEAPAAGGHAAAGSSRSVVVIRRPFGRVDEGRAQPRRRVRAIRFEHDASDRAVLRARARRTRTLSQSGRARGGARSPEEHVTVGLVERASPRRGASGSPDEKLPTRLDGGLRCRRVTRASEGPEHAPPPRRLRSRPRRWSPRCRTAAGRARRERRRSRVPRQRLTVLVLRDDDAGDGVGTTGSRSAGCSTASRSTSQDRSERRRPSSAGRSVVAAIVFPPFWLGFKLWWSPVAPVPRRAARGRRERRARTAPGDRAAGGSVLPRVPPDAPRRRGRPRFAPPRSDARPRRRRHERRLRARPPGDRANPSRLAVFFPSLLFGWLRRDRRHRAPRAFHALCNLFASYLARSYGLGA